MKMTKLFAACAAAFLLLGSGYAYAAASSSEVVADQQQIQVTGTVVDAQGVPVPGASVIIKGTATGTMTDANGKFTIAARAGATLEVSCIGYATVEVAARENVRVVLNDDAEFLEESVVVGFGTQKKVNLTGAVTAVDVEKTFGSKPITDVSKGLQGVVPGLTITYNTGDLGEAPTMKIRGTGSVNGDNKPLILVDGVEIPDLSFVNPNNIKNISVLKDAASASIYGTRAAWGVILITSKDGSGAKDKVTVTYTNNLSWNTPMALPQYITSKEGVIAQLQEGILAQKNTDGTDIEGFGMYYKDLLNGVELPGFTGKMSIERWFNEYASQAKEVWKYGQDYGYTASGTFYSFRVSDPNKELFKTSFQHQHDLNISGTSGNTKYNLGLGYSRQNSTMRKAKDTYVDRYNANISVNSQVTNWLNIGAKMMYTEKNNSYPYGYEASSSSMNLIAYTMRFPTWFPFGISDGAVTGTDANGDPIYLNSKTASGAGLEWRHGNGYLVGEDICLSTDQYISLGGNVDIKLAPGLTFHGDYTRSKLNYVNKSSRSIPNTKCANWWSSYAPAATYISPTASSYDKMYRTFVNRTTNTYNAYFDYVFDIRKEHNFAIKVGANAEDLVYNSNTSNSKGIQNPDILTMGLTDSASGSATVGEALRHRATAGFFGRINYNYKEKYLLELNGRYDGSSTFAPGHKWGFFPSASVGYKISEESFWKNIQPIVPMLKIRASFGSIGNQTLSSWYPYIASLSPATSGWITSHNGTSAATVSTPSLVNTDMTWETVRTLDVGFDASFLNKDLNVSFDWFQRDNIGMLVPGNSVVEYTGVSATPYENAGNLRSRGWELEIDYNHAFSKDFAVYGTFTISDSKAIITKWNKDAAEAGLLLYDNYEGKEFGEIWGYETDRYFTKDDFNADGTFKAGIADQTSLQQGNFKYGPGDIKYKDLNGDGKINSGKGTIADHGDVKRIGNTLPRYEYALRLGAMFKGFDFEMLFQGVGKRDMWTYSTVFLPHSAGAQMNIFEYQLDYWTEDNPNATYPRPYINSSTGSGAGFRASGNNNFYPQTKYLQNLAYLRLKSITLGYTIPEKLTKKVKIEKARVYISGYNVLTFDHIGHKMDPELTGGWSSTYYDGIDLQYAGRAVPYNRQWSCGVQITF